MPHSGLQRAILHLYRRALRAAHSKPAPARANFVLTARHAFRAPPVPVRARDVAAVEVLVRRVRRQVEMWEDASVRDVAVSAAMRAWERAWRARR